MSGALVHGIVHLIKLIIAFIKHPVEFSTVAFLVSTVACWYLILAAQLRVMLGTQDKWIQGFAFPNLPWYQDFLRKICLILENIDMPAIFIILGITCTSISTKGIYGLIRKKSVYLESYLEYRIIWTWISCVIAILYFVITVFSKSLDFGICVVLGGLAAWDVICWRVVSEQMERMQINETKVNQDNEILLPRTDADYIATSEGNVFRRNNFSNV